MIVDDLTDDAISHHDGANHSAGPTSLDSDSDDSDIITVLDDEAERTTRSARGLCSTRVQMFWNSRTRRFTEIYGAILEDPSISFQLCEDTTVVDDCARQNAHCRSVIDHILEKGYVKAFKVGLTFKPLLRFRSRSYGYAGRGWSSMVLIAVSDQPDLIAELERNLITHYRRHDRRGFMVNANGHVLCANKAPGGEGAFHGISPFFLYVVLQRPKYGLRLRLRCGN